MFISFYSIDWSTVLAAGSWILGLGIIVAAAGFFLFAANGRAKPFLTSLTGGPGRIVMVLGIVLVGAGLLFAPSRRNAPISSKRFFFLPVKIEPPPPSAVREPGDGDPIALGDLSRSQAFRVRRGILWMWGDGFVDTPWLRLEPGRYSLEIEASGTPQEDAFPRFFAAWLGIDDLTLSLRFPYRSFEATADPKTHAYSFEVDEAIVGKVRIEAYFMKTSDRNVNRSLWINGIVLRRKAA
jgi:hypothetical protein